MRILYILFFLFISYSNYATHIVGGAFDIQWQGGNNYKISLIFENAIIEITDKVMSFYYPGKVLDSQGFSIKPKIYKQIKYNRTKDFQNSLVNSVNFFIQTYLKKKLFSRREKFKALSSNKLII